MRSIARILVFLTFVNFAVCCKPKADTTLSESGKKEVVMSKFAKLYPDFNPKTFKDLLQAQQEADSISLEIYTKNDYTPIWVHDTLDTRRLYQFIEILSNVGDHGLSPELFSTSAIKNMTDSIDSGAFGDNLDLLYAKVLDLEQLSTQTAIKYITGMQFGFINPKDIWKKDYDIILTRSDSVFFKNLYTELKNDPLSTILASHPSDPVYLKLQEEYKLWENRKDSEFSNIASGDATFKVGDKSKFITNIAERLMATGEYNADGDTLHNNLDTKLLKAINKFRKQNSYPEEKEVGKITIEALNRPFSYYKNKVRANMERYRWRRSKQVHDKHIEVNVASAMLVASDAKDKDSLLISRICVGTVRNKTPLLESDISYMNLNPVWNVPKSIAQGEVAVLQKRDPTYIKRKNMKLFKGGQEVDPESIDWEEVNPSKFSYYIRQDAGYGNSLGLIKFMFDNRHSVYLHDTPSKMAFTRKNRAVSHGCVRVQRPFDLAAFCASPTTDTFRDQLFYSIDMPVLSKEGKELLKDNKLKKLPNVININPENKISLFIDYYTAFMYPNDDAVYYADDIYDYDSQILTALGLKNEK